MTFTSQDNKKIFQVEITSEKFSLNCEAGLKTDEELSELELTLN